MMALRYLTFFNRGPLAAGFWGLAGTIGLVNLARSTTPWILWPIFFLWLYLTVARNLVRGMRLNKQGYFSGRRLDEHWIYEEIQDRKVAALILPIVRTEIGRQELFIPTVSMALNCSRMGERATAGDRGADCGRLEKKGHSPTK
jgi:hypothetical protein